MIRLSLRAAVPALCLAAALPAAAQTNLAAEGEELRQLIDTTLKSMVEQSAGGDPELTVAGAPTVEPRDGGVAVIVPALTLADADGIKLSFPSTIVRLAATGDDLRQVTIEVLGNPTFVDAAGKPKATIDLGRKQMAGVWRRSTMNFDQADFSFHGVKIAVPEEQFSLDFGRLGVEAQFKEIRPGVWDGAYRLAVEGLRAASVKDGTTVTLAKAGIDAPYAGRFADYVTAARKVGALTDATYFDVAKKKPAELPGFVRFVADMPSFFSRAGSTFFVGGLEVAMGGPGAPPLVKIGAASVGSVMSGDGKSAGLDVKVSASDVAVQPGMLPVDPKLIPTSLDVDLGLGGAPLPAIWDNLIKNILDGLAAAKPGPKATAEEVLEQAAEPAFAAAAGFAMQAAALQPPKLEVRAIALGAPAASVAGSGGFTYAPSAPMQAVGKVGFRIKGLDAVLQALQAGPQTDETQGATMAVTMLRGMAKPVPVGATVEHQLDVELNAAGKVLVNGQDMSPMLQGGPGQRK